MSPSGTPQSSRSKDEDNVRPRDPKDLPKFLTQVQYDALSEDERIFYARYADGASTSLPASADPRNSLSRAPALDTATNLAATSQQEQRHQKASVDSATDLDEKAKADHGMPDSSAMDIDMTAKKPPKIWRPLTRPCAARIGSPGDEIMGNPFSHTQGWDLNVALDAGKSGLPSISLNFRISKDGIDSKDADHYNCFTVGWEPGLKVGPEWMMEHLDFERAASPSNPIIASVIFPDAIRRLCKSTDDAKRLFCGVFKCNVHKISSLDANWINVLGNDGVALFRNLQRMHCAKETGYFVTLWFMSPDQNVDDFERGCLAPLVDATEHHKPGFHLCINEDNEHMTNSSVEPNPTPDGADALRANNLKLGAENVSLRTLTQNQDGMIQMLLGLIFSFQQPPEP